MINWIKNLRSTEKGRILFKLMLYFIFLFFVIILCVVAGAMKKPHVVEDKPNSNYTEENKKEDLPNKEILTYFEKQELLYTGKYTFEYYFEKEGERISFIGSYDKGKIDGFRETNDELIYYVIEEGVAYKVSLLEREEIADLYAGLDSSIFDFKTTFSKLNSTSATINKEGELKVYNYSLEDKTYRISTDDKSIVSIQVVVGNEKYDLNFKF